MNRFLSTQGDYALLQCMKPCSRLSVCESRPYVERALPEINPETMEIPSKLIPKCPRCQGPMFLCVNGGNWFLASAFDRQRQRYDEFVRRALEKNQELFTIIEVGVGNNTPSVLRWPMDKLVNQFSNVRLIRINLQASDISDHARNQKKAVGFHQDAATVIRQLRDMIVTEHT